MKIIGITGRSGSGKSAVSRRVKLSVPVTMRPSTSREPWQKSERSTLEGG